MAGFFNLKDNNGFSFDDLFMWPADVLWGGKDKDPIFGGLYDDDTMSGMLDALKEVQGKYAEYRPEVANARTDAMNQALNLYSPANNRLKQMYGQGVDLTVTNPVAGLNRKTGA